MQTGWQQPAKNWLPLFLTRACCMAASLGVPFSPGLVLSQSSTARYSLAAMSILVQVPRYTYTECQPAGEKRKKCYGVDHAAENQVCDLGSAEACG